MEYRITPAHAGKTKTEKDEPKKEQDHPRACGENLKTLRSGVGQSGSPPRMRGKLDNGLAASYGVRITPAHAGKTAAY